MIKEGTHINKIKTKLTKQSAILQFFITWWNY